MNNAQSTNTSIVEAVEAPTVVKCRYCNRKGHSRRTHFHCAMGPDGLHTEPYDSVLERSKANHELCSLVLEMDFIKTGAVNAIRQLMPLVQPLEGCQSENELRNTYANPLLDSIMSNVENWVHLRCLERPDSIISVTMQSNWGESLEYGEAKIAEPTDNKFMLAWDSNQVARSSFEGLGRYSTRRFDDCLAGHPIQ
ncbi:hypothetical protein HMPREF1544_09948 [Mucor circinelloides 1006PhL]|uniref:Uncharacterized protein n=1 Tax=Mucor circinelloides f. circinelloides (strain 1006PhL) TaxID=1220926 RepID=S2J573_MUCC1|nr:hypothetical protein HMPREF1544_09948 [Mucor circinelloides 1006PhL]